MKSVDIRQGYRFCKQRRICTSAGGSWKWSNVVTNAGMNQFKPYFLGSEEPKLASRKLTAMHSSVRWQFRDVGRDTYHHTSFEMLGNWSFGDYYKKDAIVWAWELLTECISCQKPIY